MGFQAEVYAILSCVQETVTGDNAEKYISISSDSQATMEAFQAATATSTLLQQCQGAFNDISTQHVAGVFWVPGHAGYRGNEISDGFARSGSAQCFVVSESFLGFLDGR
jgi:ribonuclease HI